MGYYIIIICLSIKLCDCFFDPITLGGAAIGFGLLGYKFDKIKEYTYCRYSECCIDDYIPENIYGLKYDLEQKLYGQHIVINQLIPALRGHLNQDTKSRKPLVISFHGTPGTGKNFVSDYIAKHLYKKGLNSKFIHKFGRSDFPMESEVNSYKRFINNKIRTEIEKCPRSLFIFDEVDKIPQGVFESITSFLDYHHSLNGLDYTKSIFIFLSNTAGVDIGDQLYEFMKWGAQRDATQLHDFERILEAGAYSLEGGLRKAGIIEAHLIDHFIPFLPLEKQHVRSCIITEYLRWGVKPSEESVNFIMDNFVTYDPNYQLFAKSGCKRLDSKIQNDVITNYRK